MRDRFLRSTTIAIAAAAAALWFPYRSQELGSGPLPRPENTVGGTRFQGIWT